MGVGARVQLNKDKLKKEINNNTFRSLQKPVTPEVHRSMTSHFNVIKKCSQKVSNKGDVDYDKHTDSFKNPYKEKLVNRKY